MLFIPSVEAELLLVLSIENFTHKSITHSLIRRYLKRKLHYALRRTLKSQNQQESLQAKCNLSSLFWSSYMLSLQGKVFDSQGGLECCVFQRGAGRTGATGLGL